MKTDSPILGQTYEDVVTGFKGVATGYVEYLTGCNQVLLVPPTGDDNKLNDGNWLDVQRLKECGAARIVLDNALTPGSDISPPKR